MLLSRATYSQCIHLEIAWWVNLYSPACIQRIQIHIHSQTHTGKQKLFSHKSFSRTAVLIVSNRSSKKRHMSTTAPFIHKESIWIIVINCSKLCWFYSDNRMLPRPWQFEISMALERKRDTVGCRDGGIECMERCHIGFVVCRWIHNSVFLRSPREDEYRVSQLNTGLLEWNGKRKPVFSPALSIDKECWEEEKKTKILPVQL